MSRHAMHSLPIGLVVLALFLMLAPQLLAQANPNQIAIKAA